MTAASLDRSRARRLRMAAYSIATIAALACLAGWMIDPAQLLRSYLFAFVGWMELSLGCLALLMVYHLTGGQWGEAARRFLETGASALPWMAAGFLPIAFGLGFLYTWSHPQPAMVEEAMRHKALYLNTPFFLARTAGYFAVWSILIHFLRKWSRQAARADLRDRSFARLAALSGPGLVLYGLTMHFAAFDWTMSLEPEWHSTLYGFLLIASQAPPVLALALFCHIWLDRGAALSGVAAPSRLGDLGNLLLAFLMIWAYISFMQFLIIWSGNLPEEISWYLHRLDGGWQWLALALVMFQFALPFSLLLFRRVKGKPRALLIMAIGLFGIHWLHMFWLITPAFHPEGMRVHWLDLAAPAALGGIWSGLFLGRLLRMDAAGNRGEAPANA